MLGTARVTARPRRIPVPQARGYYWKSISRGRIQLGRVLTHHRRVIIGSVQFAEA